MSDTSDVRMGDASAVDAFSTVVSETSAVDIDTPDVTMGDGVRDEYADMPPLEAAGGGGGPPPAAAPLNYRAPPTGTGDEPYVTLESVEHERFYVPVPIAHVSGLVRNFTDGDDGSVVEIVYPKATALVLELILAYMAHYVDGGFPTMQRPLQAPNMDFLPEWDIAYINGMSDETLLDVLLTAHYMDIHALEDLAITRLAVEVKRMTPAELRAQFEILPGQSDFTPEEEAAVREENAEWLNAL